MVLLGWRRRSPYRIDEVVVPAEAMEGAHPEILPMYVSMYVLHALDDAMYDRDELPREALLAARLNQYVGEVNNGGHAQFVANLGWSAELRDDLKEGLATLGLDEAARIFNDLEAFSKAEPNRFRCIGGMGSAALANLFRPGSEPTTIDPYFHELDTRFYDGVGTSIGDANTAWIKTRPWLRVIPTAEYSRIQGWKTPDHPLRDAKGMRRRRLSQGMSLIARIRQHLRGGKSPN